MNAEVTENGDVSFESTTELTVEFSRILRQTEDNKPKWVEVTLDLIAWDMSAFQDGAAVEVESLCNLGKNLFDLIEETDDFKIIAMDGTAFRCHKVVLTATHCGFFLAMLNTSSNWKEKQQNEWKPEPGCSKKATELFRNFIYLQNISGLGENVGVAIELLHLAHRIEYSDLFVVIKKIIMGNWDGWLPLDVALNLFDDSRKWGEGSEDLKEKAVKAIILHRVKLKTSKNCERQLTSVPGLAAELIHSSITSLLSDSAKGGSAAKHKNEDVSECENEDDSECESEDDA
ncbi:unnamed protein product [Orchesella dallaii]|uniref:BTB domain-containing protein n=1 Tax=Orchesella dallaii TaxID=48710 RepID=A0ABP1S0U9_9HEXA